MIVKGRPSTAVVDNRDTLRPVQELSRAQLLIVLPTFWDPYLALSTSGPHISQTSNFTILPDTEDPEAPVLFPRGTSQGLWPDQRLGSSDSKKGEEEKEEDPLDLATRDWGCGALP